MNECKLCHQHVADALFMDDFGICFSCGSLMETKVKFFEEKIPDLLSRANAESNPEIKIMYLKLVLDFLYDYKINYYDNDVDVLTENIEDMIDTIIDGISYARL